jgi:hypothetical protein
MARIYQKFTISNLGFSLLFIGLSKTKSFHRKCEPMEASEAVEIF